MHKKSSWGWRRGRLVICWLALLMGAVLGGGTAAVAQADHSPGGNMSSHQNSDAANVERGTQKSRTDEFRLSKERHEKAVAYSRAGYTLYFVSVAWGIVVLLALLGWRVVARLRDFAEARSGKRIVQGLIFVPGFSVLLGVAQLPISVYWHHLSLSYQQSVQGWGSWLWDWAKGECISAVLAAVVGLLLLGVVQRAPETRWKHLRWMPETLVGVMRWKPRTWWLYFWFASIPLVLLLVLIAPWVLDPMFHRFVPLAEQDPALVDSIEKLSQRAGVPIPRDRMFLMEASTKTDQINAYVTGIGASKRVVIWDNTIRRMTPDEVLFIVGHEMGHYVLGHVVEGIAFAVAGILVMLLVAYYALQWMLKRWGELWGVRGQGDWAVLAVLLLIASVLGFLGEPIGNAFSRRIEHAADVFGLEVIHGIVPNAQETAAESFQKMGELDLADPDPPRVITFWLYSHPPLAERLTFARNYDPWDEGRAPKYVK